MNEKTYDQKLNELNEKLVDMVLLVQEQTKEAKEDIVWISQHLLSLRNKFKEVSNSMNNEIKNTNNSLEQASSLLADDFEKNSEKNYSSFLKQLLVDDFNHKQNLIIERLKNEFKQDKKTNNKTLNSLLNKISFVISITSFTLLIVICFKF
ncbi:hypothetical protein QLJ34_001778, partial [Campylobacter coli]|nr:hypothetical protein [Campylobacter coli]